MSLIAYPRRTTPFDVVGDLLDRAFERPLAQDYRRRWPAVDVHYGDEGLVLRLEIPGVPPEHVNVEIQGRTLTISGKLEAEAGEAEAQARGAEFSRTFALPQDVDPERAEAVHRHGVLTLRIPKVESARSRRIEVQSG